MSTQQAQGTIAGRSARPGVFSPLPPSFPAPRSAASGGSPLPVRIHVVEGGGIQPAPRSSMRVRHVRQAIPAM